MNTQESSNENLLNSAYVRRAIQLLQSGHPPREVIDLLFQEGMKPEKAQALINELTQLPVVYSQRLGKIKMLGGLLLMFGPAIYVAFRAIVFSENVQGAIYTIIVFGIGGLGLFVWGLIQYLIKKPKLNKKQAREFNELVYKVEEVDKTWECPKCGHENSNFTYQCANCKYDLMK